MEVMKTWVEKRTYHFFDSPPASCEASYRLFSVITLPSARSAYSAPCSVRRSLHFGLGKSV